MYYKHRNTVVNNQLKTNNTPSTGARQPSPWSSGGNMPTGRTRPSGSPKEEEAEGEVEDGIVEPIQLPEPAPIIPTF